jgi:V/A-type H+-transporting ATPase subunit C
MLKQNDYLYATARIRAMEASLIGHEKLERMLDQPTAAEAMAQVGAAAATPAEREAWFADRLAEAYREVLAMLPAPDAIRFLQYPYDCNNIKAALKCAARGIDCTSMLVGCATLPVEAYPDMVAQGDFSALPRHMAAAADEAQAVFTRTGDPQQIDLILDRACYADMREAAGTVYTAELVRIKADLTNLMISLRVLRMGLTPANRAMLEAALLPGGDIAAAAMLNALSGGALSLREAVRGSVCEEIFARFDGEEEPTAAVLECACDNAYMKRVQAAKYVSFGEAVPVAYLCAWEYAVKNMRILCAGKDAGLSNDTIRERMRACYA